MNVSPLEKARQPVEMAEYDTKSFLSFIPDKGVVE